MLLKRLFNLELNNPGCVLASGLFKDRLEEYNMLINNGEVIRTGLVHSCSYSFLM